MIECRPARPEEIAAVLALVPQAAESGSEMLIARHDGALAGAAAIVWRTTGNPAGFALSVEVVPGLRRRGVGRALVTAAAAIVRGETPGLWTAPLDGDSPALAFALACGFQPRGRTFLLGAPLEFALVRLRAKTDAARAAGAAGARAVIRPLVSHEIAVAARLVAAELGGGPVVTAAKIRGLMTDANPVPPHVALIDGRLAGVVLCHGAGTAFTVEAMVVPAAWRGAHLSQMIMRHVMEAAVAAGLETAHFQSEEQVVRTLDLIERAKGIDVPERLRCHLPVAA